MVKTAISLPEDVFVAVTSLAAEEGKSRSGLIAEAVSRYLRAAELEQMRRDIDAVWGSLSPEEAEEELRFVRAASHRAATRMDELGYTWDNNA